MKNLYYDWMVYFYVIQCVPYTVATYVYVTIILIKHYMYTHTWLVLTRADRLHWSSINLCINSVNQGKICTTTCTQINLLMWFIISRLARWWGIACLCNTHINDFGIIVCKMLCLQHAERVLLHVST